MDKSGQFSAMKDNENPFGKNAYEIISEHVREFDYPVCYGFPGGHEQINLPLVFHSKYNITITTDYYSISIH